MKPYYENGLIVELGQRITGIMREQNLSPVTITAFNNQVDTVQDLTRIVVSGPTHLDVAIDYAVNNHYVVVWMVTDNIMHRQGEEEGKTQVFYDRLKADAVARVVIFPLKQEPGKGNAGIIVYALLLSSDGSDIFKKETERFASQTRNTVLLPMKPLDWDTIETAFEQSDSEDRKKVIYSDGSVVSETLGLSFKSKFDHLNIVDAEIVNPRVSPEFSKNSLLKFEKDDVKITPTRITELGPRSKTVQVYKVHVDLGRIRLKRDFVSLWRAALKDPNEEINLDLSFSINVPKEKFQFTPDFLRDYSGETTEKAKAEGKIYALDQLPLLVANNQTSIEVPHKPKIRVRYPSWLVFVFPGLPIAALALVIVGAIFGSRAIKRMAKRPSWTVDVREPAAAEGKINNAWVIVTLDGKHNRLGRINKTNFEPATGVTPKEPQALKEGLPLNLTFRKKEYSLIFRRPPSGDGVASTRKERTKDGKRNEIKI